MKPISVTNPKWVGDKITCLVKWDELPDLPEMQFVAAAVDGTEHGPALFADLIAGEYGPIGPEDPPAPEAVANTQRRDAQEVARNALKAGPSPNTLPQLIARVDLIETMLGLK